MTIREANENDVPLVLEFIKELSVYEKMENEVVATVELLHECLFVKKNAEVLFLAENGKEVAFAFFFHNVSTFVGRSGIHLEDLFVKPQYRGKGYGKALLKKVAQIAFERKCGRLEWTCLDWNKPSIDFYLSLGAEALDEWTIYRLSGDTLASLAK